MRLYYVSSGAAALNDVHRSPFHMYDSPTYGDREAFELIRSRVCCIHNQLALQIVHD